MLVYYSLALGMIAEKSVLTMGCSSFKNKINAQIVTLQSYRKILIHECVTGKKQLEGITTGAK